MDLRFKHPFTGIIAGPTGCGKSVFVTNFIKNIKEMCNVQFGKIMWCYDEWQKLYAENNQQGIEYKQGIPDMDFDTTQPTLVILDDLMRESDGRVVDIFTKGSHHRNMSVFFISQNLFHQGRGQRDISLNAHYIIYFKNPRDKAQILHFARQFYPENPKIVREAYTDATSIPHGYVLFDLKQDTPEEYRIRSRILPNEQPAVVYIPKKMYKNACLVDLPVNIV